MHYYNNPDLQRQTYMLKAAATPITWGKDVACGTCKYTIWPRSMLAVYLYEHCSSLTLPPNITPGELATPWRASDHLGWIQSWKCSIAYRPSTCTFALCIMRAHTLHTHAVHTRHYHWYAGISRSLTGPDVVPNWDTLSANVILLTRSERRTRCKRIWWNHGFQKNNNNNNNFVDWPATLSLISSL